MTLTVAKNLAQRLHDINRMLEDYRRRDIVTYANYIHELNVEKVSIENQLEDFFFDGETAI